MHIAASIGALCAVFGALCSAVIVLPDVKLGDSITLPCIDRGHEDTSLKQLDVRWWLGKELVIGLDRGLVSYGLSFMNRTELPAGGARDYSLTITHTQPGDSGVYRCVILRENQEEPLEEVQLRVEVPRYPSAEFIKVGEEVVLPCFGRVDWFNSEAELVRWIRGDQIVLQWEKGSLYVHPQFTHRASLLKAGILKDNLSLVLKNTLHEDQGLYFCNFVNNQTIRTAGKINLTVTDQLARVKVGFGSSVLLPLHTTSAVSVRFLPDGGNSTVQVCEVKKDQLKCEVEYTGRTVLYNASLKLENLSKMHSGTFSVMETESRRTVNVLFLQVLPAGDVVVNSDPATVLLITISLVVFLGIFVATVVITKKWRQQRRPTVERIEDGLPLNQPDTTSSKRSISENEQSVKGII